MLKRGLGEALAIMVIGELVVTDGIVAYVSNKFKTRFFVDLAAAWRDLRSKRKGLLWVIVALMSLSSSSTIANLPTNMCYTSPMEHEANWALTSCPMPKTNVTDMQRVSLLYQEEWDKYH